MTTKRWRETHKEQQREYNRKYYQDHREYHKEYMRKHNKKMKQKVLEKLGNKCVRCGITDFRCLQIDHVHGGGLKETRELGANSIKYLNKVLADTEGNYQLLCANCNQIKKVENGECKRE